MTRLYDGFYRETSEATAPPTVINLVPGVTGKNQPFGIKRVRRSLNNRPDSQRTIPA